MRRALLCYITLLFAASTTLAAQAIPGRRTTYVVAHVAERDGVPRGNCVRNSTIGGIIIGAGAGYGLERLFRWR